ncbi:EAL domain-containing protein [Escherichia coli]
MTAIKREQFYVAYQPVVDTQALRVTGLEVLLRWRHPVAEKFPRMPSLTLPNHGKDDCPLTQHLFELIARDAAELENLLPVGVKLGINMRRTICTAKALKQISRNCSLPCPHTISRLCWKLPSTIC